MIRSEGRYLYEITHQKVSQDPTWTPDHTVRPSLDSTFVLVKDKDGSRLYHSSFSFYQPPGDSGYHAPSSGLKD